MCPFAVLLLVGLQAGPHPTPVHDCNGNGIEDAEDLAVGTSCDENQNGIPDECEGFGAALRPREGLEAADPGVDPTTDGATARIGLEFRGLS